jgi:hypothetical protein
MGPFCVRSSNDKPASRWALYLQWVSGRREDREIAESIDLPDGTKLWLEPIPGATPLGSSSLWSAKSRKDWLNGTDAPKPTEVFKWICDKITNHLEFAPDERNGIAATMALWVVLTYVYTAWDSIPYLYVGGPLGSGKSTVFKVLSPMVIRPLVSSNMSEAAMFRTLHERGGTLLLDEAEQLWESGADGLRTMLLAGYQRGGKATRLEEVNGTYKSVEFDVYGPKALACIRGLPPALASRCITVTMFRAGHKSPKPRRRIYPNERHWQEIRDALHMLAMSHGPAWLKLAEKSDVCPAMTGRNYELWQPILAMAYWFESHGVAGLLELTRRHALSVIESAKDDQAPDAEVILLQVLAKCLTESRAPSPTELLNLAKDQEPALFKTWSSTGVGKALSRYGIRSKKSGDRRYRDTSLDELLRIQRNYEIDLDIEDLDPSCTDGSVRSVQSVQGEDTESNSALLDCAVVGGVTNGV